MVRPYAVSLDLYRGSAYAPYARTRSRVLAPSVLEACSQAERDLNVALGDVEYAAAADARPVWEPRPASQAPVMVRRILNNPDYDGLRIAKAVAADHNDLIDFGVLRISSGQIGTIICPETSFWSYIGNSPPT